MADVAIQLGGQELTIDQSHLDDFCKDLKEGKHFGSRWQIKDGKVSKGGSIRKVFNYELYDGIIKVDAGHVACLVGGAAYRDSLSELPVLGKIVS